MTNGTTTEDEPSESEPRSLPERFQLERKLGEGGMGVVYQVFDKERRTRVALKTVPNLDAERLYRLKQEFRALSDVVHPNLVALHELLAIDDHWYFTMEPVDGVGFISYVRPAPDGPLDDVDDRTDFVSGDGDVDAEETSMMTQSRVRSVSELLASRGVLDVARLRAATRQLALGVSAVHAAGKLHRDIKPGNVLVTAAGRVVVLDFGLALEMTKTRESGSHKVEGTVKYMSPEQITGMPLTPASDWYSVGVMLYVALTGRLPFSGRSVDVLQAKLTTDALPPRRIDPTIPLDLDALCVALLARDPRARPSGPEVLAALSDVSSARPEAAEDLPEQVSPVGREREILALQRAFEASRGARGVTILLHGPSGMGRSTLTEHVLVELAENADATILRGRCHERESVPYKSVDGLVDSLAARLLLMPAPDVAAMVPPGIGALMKLFPVLERVDALDPAARSSAMLPDPRQLRRLAFGTLKHLLGQLAERVPLVICIEDLQWGDADSSALLTSILTEPDAPRALVVLSYQSDDRATPDALRDILKWREAARVDRSDVREVTVGPLSRADATALALALLRDSAAGADAQRAEQIADESHGSPMFVYELARHAHQRADASLGAAATLDDVLGVRLDALGAPARMYLEVVSVTAVSLSHDAAASAAGLDPDDELATLRELRSGRWIRTQGSEQSAVVDPFHVRIRDLVVARLDPDALRDRHARLAHTLEALGDVAPEPMALHYAGSGNLERAGHFAELAGDRAAEALAFDRAAEHYRLSLGSRTGDAVTTHKLRVRLADALALAGRAPDAATIYAVAAESAQPDEKLTLTRRAAEQWLRSGHVDTGLRAARAALSAVGLQLAESPRRALMSLLARRAQLWLRGLEFTERAVADIPTEELTRVDVCWSIALGLGMIDTIRGAEFNTRTLLLSLAAGDPYRVARSMALEVAYTASGGVAERERIAQLLDVTDAVSKRANSPHAEGLAAFARGVSAFLCGQYRVACTHCDASEVIFRERCAGVSWEITSAQLFGNMARFYLGQWHEIARRVPMQLAEAAERGDLYAATNLQLGHSNVAWLVAGDVASSQRRGDDAIQQWSQEGFHLEHFFALMADVHRDLYCGRGESALARVDAAWPDLSSTLLLRVQHVHLSALILRASSALAAATTSRTAARILARAERDAGEMEDYEAPWAIPIARVFRAGIAVQHGLRAEAASLLENAAGDFGTQAMSLYERVALRRLGALRGGEHGAKMVRGSDRWMTDHGIEVPAAVAEVLAPGFERVIAAGHRAAAD